MRIVPLELSQRQWAADLVADHFGSPLVVSRGRLHDTARLEGLIAWCGSDPVGLVQHRIDGAGCEIVVLIATRRRNGVGTALLAAVAGVARSAGCSRLWLVTTNDNVGAQRFYADRGWRRVAVHSGAVERARILKPEIPLLGTAGIPIEDEIEYEAPPGVWGATPVSGRPAHWADGESLEHLRRPQHQRGDAMSRVDDAARLFGDGHACSQAVLGAFAPSLGMDGDEALRIAAGFAGGMHLGQTCGAVTGAIMALGLGMCDETCATRDGRAAVAAAVSTFAARFRDRVGASDCPDIMGIDLRAPGARALAKERGLYASRCLPAVRAAAEILDEMLAAGQESVPADA